MSQWSNPTLTNKGRALQSKVEQGEALVFTKMALGGGTPTSPETMTELVTPKLDMTISSKEMTGEYTCTIYGMLSNRGLEEGFTAKELGLYAQDPDEGEILYLVVTDEQPDYIPNQDTLIVQRIGVGISFANATTVEVVLVADGFLSPADAENIINESLEAHRTKIPLDHPDNSVETRHLKNDSITSAKIKDRNVKESHLQYGSATDNIIGDRTINDSFSDISTNTMSLTDALSAMASQIKNITGLTTWRNVSAYNLARAATEITRLNQTKLNASIVGTEYGKIPTLNREGKWDYSLLPPLDFVPNEQIGTIQNKIALLGSGGRFSKERLPEDAVYTAKLLAHVREAMAWKRIAVPEEIENKLNTTLATLPEEWQECMIEYRDNYRYYNVKQFSGIYPRSYRGNYAYWGSGTVEVGIEINSNNELKMVDRGESKDASIYAVYWR